MISELNFSDGLVELCRVYGHPQNCTGEWVGDEWICSSNRQGIGNLQIELVRFFHNSTRRLPMEEWYDFWASLTEDEKKYYRTVDLD